MADDHKLLGLRLQQLLDEASSQGLCFIGKCGDFQMSLESVGIGPKSIFADFPHRLFHLDALIPSVN